MKIKEIAFSCYAVTDMERSRKFYEGILGLTPSKIIGELGDMQWTEYDIGASTLAIGLAPDFDPGPDGCAVALEVEDFDASIAELKAAKVKFRLEPTPTPACHLAMFHDPDGNTICLHKRKTA